MRNFDLRNMVLWRIGFIANRSRIPPHQINLCPLLVAKPIIMANAVHQGLQGSYFWIRYLFFQNPVNQMYVLSSRVNFIWNAILMNSMK